MTERIKYERLRKLKAGGELGTGNIFWAAVKPGVERGEANLKPESLCAVFSVHSLCGRSTRQGPLN